MGTQGSSRGSTQRFQYSHTTLEKLNISLLSGDEEQKKKKPAVARPQYSSLKPSVTNSDTKVSESNCLELHKIKLFLPVKSSTLA